MSTKSPAHSLKRPLQTAAPGPGALLADEGPEVEAGDSGAAEPASLLLTPVPLPAPEPPAPTRDRAGGREILVVFVLALGLTMALYHAATLHPFNTQVGGAGDADEYAWFLSWMPYALGHGLNPLSSHYLNFPGGVNLMWNTSVILPSFLMSPVTVIAGAAFSYNVLLMSGPVLSLTFCYIAFRRWTGRLPAFAGALIVGFSPFMVAQSAGHLAQTLIMSAPLILIVGDRLLVVQSSKAWWDGLLLGLLAFAQLLTGEEVLAMEAATAAIALVMLCAMSGHQLATHFRYAATGLATAGASFAVLAGPFLAYQYLGPDQVQDAHPSNAYVSDLLNFIVPTDITKFAPAAALRISSHFTGNGSEENAYIGIPLLLFVVLTLVLARRHRVTWVALAVAAGAGVLSMGPTLHIRGHVTHNNLPDYFLQKLPAFHNLLPDRFASMMTVGVGLLVALGCDQLRRVKWPFTAAGWVVVAVGLVALFPITHFPAAASPILTAFSTHLSCPRAIRRAASGHPPVALVLPVSNEMDLRWEAEADFCFAMPTATGMTGTNSGDIKSLPVLLTVGDQDIPTSPAKTAAVRAEAAQEIKSLHISEIVVGPETPASPPWTPPAQAETVVWIEWLLGQRPRQSHDTNISYVWKDLPPLSNIASGHFPRLPGVTAP